jgi:hypothetical protein
MLDMLSMLLMFRRIFEAKKFFVDFFLLKASDLLFHLMAYGSL